ncbi:hypothetical protein KAS08_00410 [Candidatus Pacearchaeota archaeon]|nr:hypothetical protein [Candidatus Pacearchaeota archaeon]
MKEKLENLDKALALIKEIEQFEAEIKEKLRNQKKFTLKKVEKIEAEQLNDLSFFQKIEVKRLIRNLKKICNS